MFALSKREKLCKIIMRIVASAARSLSAKGGDAMVTYAELFQYSLVIIGVITLCFLHKN